MLSPKDAAARRRSRPLAGPVLIGISALHIAATPLFHAPAVEAIIDQGAGNAVDSGGKLLDARAAAFWYLATGFTVALLGYLTWWIEQIAVLGRVRQHPRSEQRTVLLELP